MLRVRDLVPTQPPHTTLYTAHINFMYNYFLRIHVQPEDGYCWKAEICSCTLGSNVNTHLPSNKQVVLDKNIHCTVISVLNTTGMTNLMSIDQCFSTFVRPRPGKLFFHKTRARSQQI